MARVRYGSLVTAFKGSIGGTSFQRNSSGEISRIRPKRVKVNTADQASAQFATKFIQREWQGASTYVRNNYDNFAAAHDKIGLDGQPKTLSGYQWYMSMGLNRFYLEQAPPPDVPIFETVPQQADIDPVWDNSTFKIDFVPAIDGLLYSTFVYASFALPPVYKFQRNKCKLIYSAYGQSLSELVLTNPTWTGVWNTKFGSQLPANTGNNKFLIMLYVRLVGNNSYISSPAREARIYWSYNQGTGLWTVA